MAPRLSHGALARDPVLLAMAVVAVAVPVWFLAGPGGAALSWGIQATLDVGIMLVARRLVALNRYDKMTRRFWRGLGVAGLLCAVGDGTQTVLVAVRGPGTPISLVQSCAVVCAMTLMMVLMLRHPIGDEGRLRLRLWLDAATVLAGVAVLLWYFSIAGQLDNARIADRLAAAAGSVVMLVIVLGALKLILSGTAPFTRLAGVAGCIGVSGTALGSAASIVIVGGPDPRVDAVTSLLSCLLTVASLRIQEVQLRRPREDERRGRRRFSLMPYVAVGVTELLLVYALHMAGADARLWGVAGGVLVITGLVVTRQVIAFHDNDRLLTDLDRSVLELRELHDELRHQATHDSLTGLANRALLAEHMSTLPPAGRLSILVLDLDGFKQVNDRHGHHAGDELLVVAARRLAACVRAEDLAVRLGGDEFAVVLPHTDAARAGHLADEVTAALSRPYAVAGTVARVGASVGVATGTPADLDALLRDADTEMYRIKTARKTAAVATA
ncbi:diguanylate cyclase domain-containing protein [Dactylosporangium sp. CS-047395]|uniref:diguanylate cyclase domain-containing protein n=1 Tax=Dactylosporangium sp. CS-047395 TaxID=3239936 RepID=UPI003D8F4FE1